MSEGSDAPAEFEKSGPRAGAQLAALSLPIGADGSKHVEIFVRVRPVPSPSPRLSWDDTENKLEFTIPREASAGLVNNQREHYEFRFNGIIGPQAKQDEVFERVARNLVIGALEGYNGTIFAYGQTGSGKTFTITGGPMHYTDRGIIPRTISTIFAETTRRSDHQYAVHVSYLEIYNETGYDLLDPDREVKAMEDLPQVHVLEDEEAGTVFRNLNIHRVNNEEEALNLLFLGDTNRTISETPMNQASSRSHCIFTIHIEARKHGEEVVRRSKLNLVDLAGSERAAKTGIDGTTLREAKYINLSLHYLEQVIIALQERSMGIARPHVPYRNSKMTQVLRDSLGGNCRTIMVANVSADPAQLDESISTCRFAMRVALVRNTVAVNEEVDPSLVIRRLKQEIRDLKEEIRLLKGESEARGPLTPDELSRLREQVEAYCADPSPDAGLNLGGSMMHIRAAFDAMRNIIRAGGGLKPGPGESGAAPQIITAQELQEQMKKLRLQVAQRDNEINILVGMIKRRDQAAAAAAPSGQALAASAPAAPPAPPANKASGGAGSPVASDWQPVLGGGVAAVGASGPPDGEALLLNASLLADRNQAFELFRKSYRQNEVIEDNKATLKVKYDAAKAAAVAVNASKARINDLRTRIEARRVQRTFGGASAGAGLDGQQQQPDPEEERLKADIEREKGVYKAGFEQLRGLKSEIEALHLVLEQSRARLHRDFEQWMGLMKRPTGGTAQMPDVAPANSGTPSPAAAPQRPTSARATAAAAVPAQVTAGALGWTATAQRHSGSASLRASFSSDVASRVAGSPQSAASALGVLAAQAKSVPVPRQAWAESGAQAQAVGSGKPTAGTSPPSTLDTAAVSPEVMAAARAYLTGNAEADQDIIRFYVARQQLLTKMQAAAVGASGMG